MMLIKAKTFKGYKLHCSDGEIGKVSEFIFDDLNWTVRYLTVETGTWLMDRQVLISPQAVNATDEESEYITVDLTKKQIEESPLLYKDSPISRQFETSFNQYYGLPTYWNGPSIMALNPNILNETAAYKEAMQGDIGLEPHLRSTDNVDGRRVHATDGEIGHVKDFIIDDKVWVIRYLVISTQNWLPGRKVLISPKWIERIGWDDFAVYIKVHREAVKLSPEYSDDRALNRDYEDELHKHYDQKGYWDTKPDDNNAE